MTELMVGVMAGLIGRSTGLLLPNFHVQLSCTRDGRRRRSKPRKKKSTFTRVHLNQLHVRPFFCAF